MVSRSLLHGKVSSLCSDCIIIGFSNHFVACRDLLSTTASELVKSSFSGTSRPDCVALQSPLESGKSAGATYSFSDIRHVSGCAIEGMNGRHIAVTGTQRLCRLEVTLVFVILCFVLQESTEGSISGQSRERQGNGTWCLSNLPWNLQICEFSLRRRHFVEEAALLAALLANCLCHADEAVSLALVFTALPALMRIFA